MIKRLRLKFICITQAILMVMMTILLLSHYNFTVEGLMQLHVNALEEAARDFRSDPPPEFADVDMARSAPDKPAREKPEYGKPGELNPCFILALDSQGNLEAGGSGFYNLTNQDMLMDIYQRAVDKEDDTGVLWDYSLRFLRSEDQNRTFYVFTDVSSEVQTMDQVVRNGILIWILGFICFLILTIVLAEWAIRPVERAWEQQRQFVADASHELKTPLTVILTNAELLQEGLEKPDQRRFADSIVAVSQQMRDLVANMLQLARADIDHNAVLHEKLDLSRLAEQVLLPMEPMFFEAGFQLESAIEPGVTVQGDAAALRQVAEILLDNALKYAAPGGTVVMALRRQGYHARLSVASPGQTLTAGQCRDIFKRFYRLDQARSRNGSYGLGLAIAERIVTDHRGRIWAEGRDGINTFYVNLPLS